MKHTTRWALALAAAATAAPAAAQAPHPEGPLNYTARPTAPAITANDLRTHVYTLAADSMKGRESGTRGNVMGTDYIAAQAQRMGLQPAGDNGTFFQSVPLVEMGLTPGASLRAGGEALAEADFLPVPTYGGILLFGETFTANDVAVVYGGRVGDPASMISPAQASGKFVVFDAPLGADGRPSFAFWAGGRTYERYADAAGLGFATLDVTNAGIRGFLSDERVGMDHGDEDADPRRFPPAVILSQSAAARLMGKPLSGLRVGEAGGTASGSYSFFSRPLPFPSRNVVAVLPGTDPALRGQYVALGSHNDHDGMADEAVDHDSVLVYNRVFRPEGADGEAEPMTAEREAAFRQALAARRAAGGMRMDSVYNGADDDASGSASMLEIAQHLAANRPRRSVLFVWHTAEEKGLLGSEYYTDHPTVPRDSIVAQLNVDMLGRGGATDRPGAGPAYLELVGSRRLSTQLGDLIEEVNRTGSFGFRFDYGMDATGHPQQIYCRSDHANYARYGIPVTFFTTGGHSDYHMVTDEAQYIDYDKLASASRLIGAVATAVGNRDARLVVDKPVAGPDAPCEQ